MLNLCSNKGTIDYSALGFSQPTIVPICRLHRNDIISMSSAVLSAPGEVSRGADADSDAEDKL